MSKASIDSIRCSNAILRKAARRLGQLYDEAIDESGLKATQFALLAEIRGMSGATMKQLADALVMDLSALGHTLKPLTRDGFVMLFNDTRDRRCKRVTLTPHGEDKLDAAIGLWRVANDRFETAFGPRKAEKLRKALSVVASDDFSQAFLSSTKLRRSPRDP